MLNQLINGETLVTVLEEEVTHDIEPVTVLRTDSAGDLVYVESPIIVTGYPT